MHVMYSLKNGYNSIKYRIPGSNPQNLRGLSTQRVGLRMPQSHLGESIKQSWCVGVERKGTVRGRTQGG